MHPLFSDSVFLFISFYFIVFMLSQFPENGILNNISMPNTNWPGKTFVIVWCSLKLLTKHPVEWFSKDPLHQNHNYLDYVYVEYNILPDVPYSIITLDLVVGWVGGGLLKLD